jgi:signal transduction histidine kinase/ActR/RegA family two-component response regulator
MMKKIILMLAALFIVQGVIGTNIAAKTVVKVGVYQNIPLTFIEENGEVKGFYIDILEHIADKQDWQIEFVPDTWADCLDKLKKGETDLLGVIAYSVERNKYLDYTYESVLTEWGQIYTNKNARIESILDLRDKKIAVLQADMHYLNLKNLMSQFGINCRYVEAFEYEDVLMLTERGICDAGLVSHFYGMQYERKYYINKSSVILSPQKLYWASPKEKNPKLLHVLDNHLRQLKKDEQSIYYQSLNRWFGVNAKSEIGKWVKWFSIGAAALLALFFGVNVVLRSKIKARTRELSAQTKALTAEIEHRKQAETERAQLEARLQRAQKMEALGTLAGGVAHDLNNILSGLVSYPELLLLDIPQDSPLRRPILTMKDSGEKASAIVQDMLTLARRGVAVTEAVNLNRIIEDYMKSPEFDTLMDNHPGVRFHLELQHDLLNIAGSPVHLSKTVMNLAANASEAMPNGGLVRVVTENRYIDRPVKGYDDVQEGDYVVLTIADSGVGIPPKDIERIFEPFYTKKVMGLSGSGLGMAVVWGAVKDHKGYIDVQSTEGEGSTFKLYFPVNREKTIPEKPALTLDALMGNGQSLLVVDDIAQQREIASEILIKLGYNVNAASSGEEAVAYLKKNPADLLVLDMIMEPGIDGLETYRKVVQFRPGQKAIIASGFSETDRVKAAQRLGAGAYVKKPYTLEKIGMAVKVELEKK